MARSNRILAIWSAGQPMTGHAQAYPGETLGLPERGPGSLARWDAGWRRCSIDWLLAYGLALSA